MTLKLTWGSSLFGCASASCSFNHSQLVKFHPYKWVFKCSVMSTLKSAIFNTECYHMFKVSTTRLAWLWVSFNLSQDLEAETRATGVLVEMVKVSQVSNALSRGKREGRAVLVRGGIMFDEGCFNPSMGGEVHVNNWTFNMNKAKTQNISSSLLITLDSSHNHPSPVHR